MTLALFDRFAVSGTDRGVAGYVLGSLCVARNARERAWRQALALAPRGWSTRLLDAADRQPLPDLTEIGAARLSGRRTGRWVLMKNGLGGGVAFLFDGARDEPMTVLKIRPARGAGPRLEAEARHLRWLASVLPPALAATVPSPLAHVHEGGEEFLWLSVVPGRSAYADLHRDFAPRRHVGRHFAGAARWLAAFHAATRPHQDTPVDIDRLLEDVLMRAGAGAQRSRAAWVDVLRARWAHAPVARAASHGDFWARNVHFPAGADDRVVGVVDWEHFQPAALPSDDLFQFALTYGESYPWARYRRVDRPTAFARTFLSDTHVSRHVVRYLQDYVDRTGLDAALLRSLCHLFLLSRAAGDPARPAPASRESWLDLHRLLAGAQTSVLERVQPSGGAAHG
jgi:aminoglycoside phosphotransferase